MRNGVHDEIDAELEGFRGRSYGIDRLVDQFPEVADVVVEADDDGEIALLTVDPIENRIGSDIVGDST